MLIPAITLVLAILLFPGLALADVPPVRDVPPDAPWWILVMLGLCLLLLSAVLVRAGWSVRRRASLLQSRLSVATLAFVCVTLTSCVNGKLSPVVAPVVGVIDQLACEIAQVTDPKDSTYIGSVCAVAVPGVNGVLTGLESKASGAAAKTCHLVPISPDGKTGYGVVCDRVCGVGATSVDPCPAVDAKLRGMSLSAAVKQ